MITFENTVSDVRQTVLDKVIAEDPPRSEVESIVHSVAWNVVSGRETVFLVNIIEGYGWEEDELQDVFADQIDNKYRESDGSPFPLRKVLKSVAKHAIVERVLVDIFYTIKDE